MQTETISPMYLGGELVSAETTAEVVNPATGECVGRIAAADVSHADQALAAARDALPAWAGTPVAERVEWMHKLRAAVLEQEEQLRLCVHLEMGKTWADTEEDFRGLVDSLSFYAEEIQRRQPEALADPEGTHSHRLQYEPVGVVVAFLAWNFPLLNIAYKLGPALAAGCPIVIKPSLKSPLSAYLVGELCAAIGLPAGVVNILAGDDAVVGDALSRSTIPALLTLIGSTRTGMHIMRTGATSIKRYSLELGGNAPVLVFADADLDQAADVVCALKFGNAGQICVAPNRVFVDAAVADTFREKVVARAEALTLGFDRHAAIDMGPVVDADAWSRIDGLVQDAVAHGARLLTGGERPAQLASGSFYAPTVLDGINPEMRLYHEEAFGPVVGMLIFDNEAQLLAAANDTDAGLTAYVFTRDEARAERCAQQLRFGEIQINGVKYGMTLPHCGIKQSGIGVDGSYLALDEYLVPKRISRALDAGQGKRS